MNFLLFVFILLLSIYKNHWFFHSPPPSFTILIKNFYIEVNRFASMLKNHQQMYS